MPSSWPRRAPPENPERDPARREGAAPGRDGTGRRFVHHLRPLLGQLGRDAVRHPARLLAQRRPTGRAAGGRRRGGRRVERGHGAPGRPGRRPPAPLDRAVRLVGPPVCALAHPGPVVLRRRAGPGGDRRRLHRHGHERRGVPPTRRQPVCFGALPRALQRRRAHGRGHRRPRDPRRRVMALGMARHRAGGPGGGRVGPHHRRGHRPHPRRHRRPRAPHGGPPSPAPAPRRVAGAPGRVRSGRGHRGGRGHVGRALPAQPPGHRRPARGRGLRHRAIGGRHHPGRRGVPRRPPDHPAHADHRRLRRGRRHLARVALAPLGPCRARARTGRGRRLTLLAARHEHRQPDGEPGRQRGRRVHRRRLRGLGGRGAASWAGSRSPSARPGGSRSWPWPLSGSPGAPW